MEDTKNPQSPKMGLILQIKKGVTESQLASIQEPSKKTVVKFLVDVFMEIYGENTLNATFPMSNSNMI